MAIFSHFLSNSNQLYYYDDKTSCIIADASIYSEIILKSRLSLIVFFVFFSSMKCLSRSVSTGKKFNASIKSSVEQNISEYGDTQLRSISSIAENVFDGSKLMGNIINRTNSLPEEATTITSQQLTETSQEKTAASTDSPRPTVKDSVYDRLRPYTCSTRPIHDLIRIKTEQDGDRIRRQ